MSRFQINSEILSRFLSGNASDQEFQQVEALLDDPDTVVEMKDQASEDTLVWEIKNLVDRKPELDADDPEVSRLIEKINAMVPCPAIGQEELDRVLDPPEDVDEIGRIGDYRVIEFMAGGGMGLVFRAHDPQLDRLVCIKIMHPSLSSNPEAKQRFDREARAAAKLRNERIVTVFDVGQHRELPFLVMQLLDGASLAQHLHQEGAIEESRARKFALQIAEGLAYAHGLGYLHRDIKPDNIWITEQDDVKLLDFGLARAVHDNTNLTNTGTVLGTPSYMSPEQVHGADVDQRSDLFSLGTVFFEMLTGRCPFSKANLFSTMMSVAKDSLPVDVLNDEQQIPAELTPIIQQLLEKDPADRTASAEKLVQQLGGKGGTLASAKAKPWGHRERGWRHVWLGALGAAAALFLGFMFYQATDKGTLIVKADPSVEVKMQGGIVTIYDPQTEKSREIRIGEQPLPSGVYQLETTDGDLVLSAPLFTIRRGVETIVTVELRPATTTKTDGSAEASSESENNNRELTAANDDHTPLLISSLPPLSGKELTDLGFAPGQRLSSSAIVTQPKVLDKASSWTIEPVAHSSENLLRAINVDGSLVATGDETGFVRIWNRDGQLVHVLPSQCGSVRQFRWSPNTNVLAVAYAAKDKDSKPQVWLWHIKSEHAEIIDTIDINAGNVAWSMDSTRLAIQRYSTSDIDLNPGISFYRLDQGTMFVLPNQAITGLIGGSPWSADGRYFAAVHYSSKQVDAVRSELKYSVRIWDTQTGQTHHEFNDARSAQWIPDSNELAIKTTSGGLPLFEIWDISSLTRTRSFNASSGSSLNRMATQSARLDNSGTLRIEGSDKDQARLLDMKSVVGSWRKWVQWSGNGKWLLVAAAGSIAVVDLERDSWQDFSQFELPPLQISWENDLQKRGRQKTTANYYSSGRLVDLHVEHMEREDNQGSSFAAFGQPIDLRTGQLGAHRWKFLDDSFESLELAGGKKRLAIFRSKTSHDLNWLLEAEKPVANSDKSNVTTQVRLIPVFGNEARLELEVEGSVGDIQWCPENQVFLFASFSADQVDEKTLNIIDVKNSKHRKFPLASSKSLVGNFAVRNGMLLLPMAHAKRMAVAQDSVSQRQGRARREFTKYEEASIWLVDLATSKKINEVDLGTLYELGDLLVSPEMILLRVTESAEVELEKGDRKRTVNRRLAKKYEIREDGSKIELHGAIAPVSPDTRGASEIHRFHSISQTGRFVSTMPGYKESLSVMAIAADGNTRSVAELPFSRPNFYPHGSSVVWHPRYSVLALLGNESQITLFNAKTTKSKSFRLPGRVISGISASENGWLLSSSSGLIAIDFDGEITGFVADVSPGTKGKKSSDHRPQYQWISRRGEIRDDESTKHLRAVYLQDNLFKTCTIDEFAEKFGDSSIQRSRTPEFLETQQ